jgi:surface antigen
MNDMFVAGVMLNNHMKQYVAIAFATVAVVIALPVLAIFSMGSGVVSFLSAVPSAEAAASQGFYMGGIIPGDTYAWGNCTYWAFAERLWANKPIPTSWGNANTWDDRAIADDYVVDHTPAVGAVFQTDAGSLGHVAYVTIVEKDTGKWTISEMNNEGLNMVSTRTFAASSAVFYNFIHNKKATQ